MQTRYFENYSDALDFLSECRRDGYYVNLAPTLSGGYRVSWWWFG